MPVKFPEFDIDTVPEDTAEDLKIIDNDVDDIEDTPVVQKKDSPFITPPTKKKVFKPPPVSETKEIHDRVVQEDKIIEKEQKRERKKKQLSEKQRAHLERMRLKKAAKKMEKVKETIQSTDNNISIPEYKEPTPEELADMEKKEFDDWLKHMSKFEKMVKLMNAQKQKEAMAKAKKEAEMEAKYRKKFEAELKAKQQSKPKPILKQPVNFNPLQQQQENNPYDSYFSF